MAMTEATLPEKGAINFGAGDIWLKLLVPHSEKDEIKKLMDWCNSRLGVSIVVLRDDCKTVSNNGLGTGRVGKSKWQTAKE